MESQPDTTALSDKRTPFLDRPISSSRDDLLGRAAFAQTLARAILAWRGNDSLTLAVSGDWGSGKTSLKNMVIEYLKERPEGAPEIVEFNPWKWTDQEKISSEFFREISIALHKVDKTAAGKRRVRRWRRYGRLLTFGSEAITDFSTTVRALLSAALAFGWLAYLSPAGASDKLFLSISVAATAVATFLRFGGSFATKAAAMFNENIQDEEQRSLEERREELADDLRALPKPVLVVIDDIDRITRDETRLLFQHVKANADFPNLVYLLLYHEELVAKHLEEPSLSGKAFLEKIVQLPLHMPAIPLARVQKVLFSGLDQIIENQQNVQFDQRRWGNLFLGALSTFFSNLRDVNRFLSTFSVHVGLFQSPRAFEVNIIDLIAIETIRLFEPPAYERIAASKELLTSGAQREKGGAIPTAIQAIVDSATEPRRDTILELLKQLFPPIEVAFGGASYSGEFRQVWRDDLRVCSSEVFDRYFQLGVPEGDLSESEFRELVEFCNNTNQFVQKFEDIQSRALLDVVLARLDAYGPRLDLAHVRPLLTALLRIGEDLPETRGMFGLGGELHVMRIIIRYLGQEPAIRTRGEMFLQAFQDSEQIVIPAWVISNEDSIREKQSRRDTESIIEDDQLALAKATWCDKILHVCRYNPEWFLRSPQLVFLLYRWREWAQEIGPATALSGLINSRERAIDFITSIAQTSTVHRSGDHVSEKRKLIRWASVEDFMALNALLALADPASLKVAELNTQQVAALQALQEAVQRREEGKSDDRVS